MIPLKSMGNLAYVRYGLEIKERSVFSIVHDEWNGNENTKYGRARTKIATPMAKS